MDSFPIRVGLDDTATGSQEIDGFAFFCLPERYVGDFTSDFQKLLKKHDTEKFHGVDFNKEQTNAYEELIALIFEYFKKSLQSFVACRLFSKDYKKKQLKAFGQREVRKFIVNTIGDNNLAIEHLTPYFLPLATLAALSRNLAMEVVMHVEMDNHTAYKDLYGTSYNKDGVSIKATTLLKDMYNKYAKALHSRTPLLPDGGLHLMKASQSALIQAADVIGHFAQAHFFVCLGSENPKKNAKASILRKVFGNDLPTFDPTGKITMSGNDLILTHPGSATFKIGWQITKGPDNPNLQKDWPKDDGFLGRSLM